MVDLPGSAEPIGTVWVPPRGDGPLAEAVRGMDEGVIRVRKVCRSCREPFTAWMFLAFYNRLVQRGEVAESSHEVGRGGMCGACVTSWESSAKVRTLLARLDAIGERFAATKTLKGQRALMVQAKIALEELTAAAEFGTPVFRDAAAKTNKVETWLREHPSVDYGPLDAA